MREIKFRAWDKHEKKLHHVKSIHFQTNLIDCSYSGGVFSPGKYYDLMQFTGLTDQNGEEIYEGDIIRSRFPGRPEIPVIVHEIIFSGGRFQTSDVRGYYIPGSGLDPTWWGNHCEVIGNIYENPELLT